MRYLLLLLLILQPVPPPALSATWQGTVLLVSWQAPGFHTVWLDNQPVDSAVDRATFQLRTGGVSAAYVPRPGQTLSLVDDAGQVIAQMVVPPWLRSVALPMVIVSAPRPPPPVYRLWLPHLRR